MPPLRHLIRPIRAAAESALDLALPPSCAGCGQEGTSLCKSCSPAVNARLGPPAGIPIGLPGEVPAHLVQVEWCATFTGITRRALHQLKYSGDGRIAHPLGLAVARRWAQVGAGGDVLVPVPASADRVRDRGYDQAVLIAEAAAAELKMPVRNDILERGRRTIAQFDLDRSARGRNVRGAFQMRDGSALPRGSGPDGAPWIVLVDDVLTTGSTLSACASTLLSAGAWAVSALVVARER